MIGYVYILKSNDGRYYVGSTGNIERRLKQHQQGHTQTTRNFGSFQLVFSQKYDELWIARKIELRLKKLKRKDYIEKIVKDGFIKIKINCAHRSMDRTLACEAENLGSTPNERTQKIVQLRRPVGVGAPTLRRGG